MRRPSGSRAGPAPKKYTDASKSEITPEWKEWYQLHLAESAEEAKDLAVQHGIDPEERWPEDYGKDLGEGCWILVVEEPHTELRSRFRVPTPSLWWARPEAARPYGQNYGTTAYPVMVPGIYRAVIQTPGGTLWLYPHEYVVCSDPLPLITDPECTIHPLGGRPTLDEDRTEQLFYLQSRGWSYQDALLQLMDGVDMSDWGWVEFPEYARAAFEGVGRKVRLTDRNVRYAKAGA